MSALLNSLRSLAGASKASSGMLFHLLQNVRSAQEITQETFEVPRL